MATGYFRKLALGAIAIAALAAPARAGGEMTFEECEKLYRKCTEAKKGAEECADEKYYCERELASKKAGTPGYKPLVPEAPEDAVEGQQKRPAERTDVYKGAEQPQTKTPEGNKGETKDAPVTPLKTPTREITRRQAPGERLLLTYECARPDFALDLSGPAVNAIKNHDERLGLWTLWVNEVRRAYLQIPPDEILQYNLQMGNINEADYRALTGLADTYGDILFRAKDAYDETKQKKVRKELKEALKGKEKAEGKREDSNREKLMMYAEALDFQEKFHQGSIDLRHPCCTAITPARDGFGNESRYAECHGMPLPAVAARNARNLADFYAGTGIWKKIMWGGIGFGAGLILSGEDPLEWLFDLFEGNGGGETIFVPAPGVGGGGA